MLLTITSISTFCRKYLFLFLLLGSACVQFVHAQSVHPSLSLGHPTVHSANSLELLRDSAQVRVGLYVSEHAIQASQEHQDILRESTKQWEYFLVGLGMPYRLLSDSALHHTNINAYSLIIALLPESVADSSLSVIQDYVHEGGGVIASGYVGASPTKKTAPRQMNPFAQFVGAQIIAPHAKGATGAIQPIDNKHPVFQGLPLGAELQLLPSPYAYVASNQEWEGTMILPRVYGAGRMVWLGFNPQDIPVYDEAQRIHQGLTINAMAYATRSVHVVVGRWPEGHLSAVSFAQLPSAGYQPFFYRTSSSLLLEAFEKQGAPSTFFLVARHMRDHPDLLKRMANVGELALVADTQKPLAGSLLNCSMNACQKQNPTWRRRSTHKSKAYPHQVIFMMPIRSMPVLISTLITW